MSYDSKQDDKKTEDKVSFFDRLIYGKGTVAEPWSTVKEVLSEKSVQEDIKKVENAFKVIDKKNS